MVSNNKKTITKLIGEYSNRMMLIDFCNIDLKQKRYLEILKFQKKYKVFYTKYGATRGYEEFCISKNDLDQKSGQPLHFWYLTGNPKSKILNTGQSPEVRNAVILPSNDENSHLFSLLAKSQREYEKFITKCTRGSLDLEFTNNLLQEGVNWNLSLKRSSKIWNPRISYGINYLRSLESYIDWEILELFFNQYGELLGRIGKCAYSKCGKYYLKDRINQRYCTPNKCGRDSRAQRYRQTEKGKQKRKKYLEDARVAGVYIPVRSR